MNNMVQVKPNEQEKRDTTEIQNYKNVIYVKSHIWNLLPGNLQNVQISNVLRDIYERGRVQLVNVIYAACLKWIFTNNCIIYMYARSQTFNSVFKRLYICITCDQVSMFSIDV